MIGRMTNGAGIDLSPALAELLDGDQLILEPFALGPQLDRAVKACIISPLISPSRIAGRGMVSIPYWWPSRLAALRLVKKTKLLEERRNRFCAAPSCCDQWMRRWLAGRAVTVSPSLLICVRMRAADSAERQANFSTSACVSSMT